MPVFLPDYKVSRLRLDSIAQTADGWRKADGTQNDLRMNTVRFFERTLKSRIKNVDVRLNLLDLPEQQPAYVTFKRPDANRQRSAILNIDPEVWELASLGEPKAQFVTAHEFGHIVLHDHEAKAFSDMDALRAKQFELEETAEWQADTFALCLLMPARIVVQFECARSLCAAVGVEYSHAKFRFEQVHSESWRHSPFSGYACDDCGEFKMSRKGIEMVCECGFSKPVV